MISRSAPPFFSSRRGNGFTFFFYSKSRRQARSEMERRSQVAKIMDFCLQYRVYRVWNNNNNSTIIIPFLSFASYFPSPHPLPAHPAIPVSLSLAPFAITPPNKISRERSARPPSPSPHLPLSPAIVGREKKRKTQKRKEKKKIRKERKTETDRQTDTGRQGRSEIAKTQLGRRNQLRMRRRLVIHVAFVGVRGA